MAKVFMLFCLLIFVANQSPKNDLKSDLRKDRCFLNAEHADHNNALVKNLKQFDFYADMSLADAKFEKHNIGKHTVLKWKKAGASAVYLYEVISVMQTDTVYEQKVYDYDSLKTKYVIKTAERINLKPSTAIFHTYIIKPTVGKQLIYMTDAKSGLSEYWIGSKRFYPIYESIPLGVRFPDLKEILKLINK